MLCYRWILWALETKEKDCVEGFFIAVFIDSVFNDGWFYSIIQSVKYHETGDLSSLRNACLVILLAMILDGLDSRVARLTQTQSDFGAQLDSLSDMISFGLQVSWCTTLVCMRSSWGVWTWLVCFILPACTALRLARFNSQDENINKVYFRGLPSPIGAGVIACHFWLISIEPWMQHKLYFWIGLCISLPIALLEVSRLRYRSFKDFDVRERSLFRRFTLFTGAARSCCAVSTTGDVYYIRDVCSVWPSIIAVILV